MNDIILGLRLPEIAFLFMLVSTLLAMVGLGPISKSFSSPQVAVFVPISNYLMAIVGVIHQVRYEFSELVRYFSRHAIITLRL